MASISNKPFVGLVSALFLSLSVLGQADDSHNKGKRKSVEFMEPPSHAKAGQTPLLKLSKVIGWSDLNTEQIECLESHPTFQDLVAKFYLKNPEGEVEATSKFAKYLRYQERAKQASKVTKNPKNFTGYRAAGDDLDTINSDWLKFGFKTEFDVAIDNISVESETILYRCSRK